MNLIRLATTLPFLLIGNFFFAQPGTWTWIKGSNQTNQPGIFGTLGVPSPANTPPALYECAHWKDLEGNLWLFGGLDLLEFAQYNTLWKYNISTNEWVWMKGGNTGNAQAVYGVQGIPADANTPGANSYGAVNWVDLNGNFWLFGGFANGAGIEAGFMNDLWMYNPATNQWTWMNGPGNMQDQDGEFGTMGVPGPGNYPPGTAESNIGWVSDDNKLWLFGGQTANNQSQDNLWCYDIATNQWTWMSGGGYNSLTQPAYGTLGTESPANHPGSRNAYAAYRDEEYFYLCGGNQSYVDYRNDVWRLNPQNLQWTWIGGSTGIDESFECEEYCTTEIFNEPGGSFELRASVGDNCGFYLFGGFGYNPEFLIGNSNSLWYYDYETNLFTWLKGELVNDGQGSYGVQGVPDVSNLPPARNGGAAWLDDDGNFWIFGGVAMSTYNDLWKYVPDPDCAMGPCTDEPLMADFYADANIGCAPATFQFTNTSTNAMEYQWYFGDGGSSNMENPFYTYNTPGVFEVMLIASDSLASDTATVPVNILATATASFNIYSEGECPPFEVSFTSTSNNADELLWTLNGSVVETGMYYTQLLDSGNYIIELIALTAGGCNDTLQTELELLWCEPVFLNIPNIFTPNSDSENSYFEIENRGMLKYHLQVFDRWGLLMFESDIGTKHWNGRIQNNGEECSPGTYYYLLEAADWRGNSYDRAGYVMLIRE